MKTLSVHFLLIFIQSRPFCLVRSLHEPCHEKKCLKIFVVVIPKEGLVGKGPANPPFGMTPTTDRICEGNNFIVGVMPIEGLAGPQPANPPLGMTMTKILRHVFPWHVHSTHNKIWRASGFKECTKPHQKTTINSLDLNLFLSINLIVWSYKIMIFIKKIDEWIDKECHFCKRQSSIIKWSSPSFEFLNQ